MMVTDGQSFLSTQFHEFYREVVRHKRQLQRGEWVFESQSGPSGEAADRPAPSAIWQSLLTLLERQALAARHSGGDFATEIYRQAQYVMAALADEIFLNLEWAGKEAWQENLLEAHLFQSHRAGEEVFERLDELLLRHDPVYLDLARLYLFLLALGFQGRFRGQPDGDLQLANYRRRLFNFISGRDPEPDIGKGRLFPAGYAGIVELGPPARLPYLRRWFLTFGALILVWIVVAHPVWRRLVRDLEPIIRSILP